MKPVRFVVGVSVVEPDGRKMRYTIEPRALTPGLALIAAIIDLELMGVSPEHFKAISVSKERD